MTLAHVNPGHTRVHVLEQYIHLWKCKKSSPMSTSLIQVATVISLTLPVCVSAPSTFLRHAVLSMYLVQRLVHR